MDKIVEFTVRLVGGTRLAYARKWSFLGLFAVVFIASVFVLAVFDLLPNAPSTSITNAPVAVNSVGTVSSMNAEVPVKIEIPSLTRVASISNPDTTDIAALDTLLLSGAVRYPTSAKLGESGNIVLFGHASYLPVVNNQAYKTFNGIQKLSHGDVITVYSSDAVYTYAVRTVEKKSADDGEIALSGTGRVLTLVTCNSFGAKEDRFVVTADFVESHSLGA